MRYSSLSSSAVTVSIALQPPSLHAHVFPRQASTSVTSDQSSAPQPSIIIPKPSTPSPVHLIVPVAQDIHAVSPSGSSASDTGASIIHVTAPTSVSAAHHTSIPHSPYQEDVLGGIDMSWFILCGFACAIFGILVGWFIIPLFFPRWRARCKAARKGAPVQPQPDPQEETPEVPAQTPKRATPLSDENQVKVTTSGAQARHLRSEIQSRKRSGAPNADDEGAAEQTPSRVKGPRTSLATETRPSTPVTVSSIKTIQTALRMHSPSTSVRPYTSTRRKPSPLSTAQDDVIESVNERRKSRATSRDIRPLTPLLPTAEDQPPSDSLPSRPRNHTRTLSVPPSAHSILKRSSAAIDLTALSDASSFPYILNPPFVRRSNTDPIRPLSAIRHAEPSHSDQPLIRTKSSGDLTTIADWNGAFRARTYSNGAPSRKISRDIPGGLAKTSDLSPQQIREAGRSAATKEKGEDPSGSQTTKRETKEQGKEEFGTEQS